MIEIYPGLDWYLSVSKNEDSSPRCPYANVRRCHRYYSSLYVLGKARITTKMTSQKVDELDKLWEGSDLIPVIDELDTGIASDGDKASDFCNFCPEISYDIYGLFSSHLHRHSDEIDRDIVHKKLISENNTNSWRWDWSHIVPVHYLKCSVYSQVLNSKSKLPEQHNEKQEIVTLKPTLFGFSIDLKALIKRWRSK